MPDDKPAVDANAPVPSNDKLEETSRDTGASKEQVAQLRRSTEDDTELNNAAAAAARWS